MAEQHQAANNNALRSALERLERSYRLLLARKPVRDVEETLSEVTAALAASKAPEGAAEPKAYLLIRPSGFAWPAMPQDLTPTTRAVHEADGTRIEPLYLAPPAVTPAAPSDAEALLTEMAKAPGTVIRSSRDMAPAEIAASRAAGKWLTLRDGLGFAIIDEHARQVAEDEPAALKSVQPSAPESAVPSDAVTGLHLAVIGRRHFGNPIPAAWYGAARELEAAVAAQQGTGTATPAGWTKEQVDAHIQDVCEEDIRGPVGQRGGKL